MWKRTCILSDSQQRVSSIFLGGKHYELINFYHCILWIIARIRKMKTNSLVYSDVSYISILDYGRELQGLICKAHRVGLSMQVAADGYLLSRRHNFAMGLASMHIAQLLDVSYLKGKCHIFPPDVSLTLAFILPIWKFLTKFDNELDAYI